ncbi:MAG: hypothetical protein J6U98_08155, partial [Abditibacteriota bacterium]|nr:hypothetical protein [Abditibacteriota bacterium]
MKKLFSAILLLIAVSPAAFSAAYDAQILSYAIPHYAAQGSTRKFHVMVLNTGTNTWTQAEQYLLGCDTGNGQGTSDPFGVTRVGLPDQGQVDWQITPTSTHIFTFDRTFSPAAGTYTTYWRMIREHVTWFGNVISQQVQVVNAAGGNWDVYDDFPTSGSTAVSGPWSFGSRTGSTFTVFNAYDSGATGCYEWHKSGNWDDYGYVGRRTDPSWTGQFNQLRLPFMVYLGSTFGSGQSDIRFTCPYKATYYIEYMAQPVGLNETDTWIYFYHNNAEVKKNQLTSSMFWDGRLPAETSANTLKMYFTRDANAGDYFDLWQDTPTAVSSCTVIPMYRILCVNPKCVVSGNVKSSYGNSNINGAEIYDGSTRVAATNSSGNFSFDANLGSSAKTYTVKYTGHTDGSFTFTPNAASRSANVTLTAQCVVSGTITSTYPSGGAVSGAQIKNGSTVLATSDSSGNYSFTTTRS